jgi:hypothetical protein
MERREFGRFGPRITADAEEGDMTIEMIDGRGGEYPGPVFTNKIRIGDYVKLVGNLLFARCEAGDPEMWGVAISKPKFKGMQPDEGGYSDEIKKRKFTVELMADKVTMVQLEPANSEIEAGDSLIFGGTTDQTFDKSTKTSIWRALVGSEAASGAEIPAVFGFKGNPILEAPGGF